MLLEGTQYLTPPPPPSELYVVQDFQSSTTHKKYLLLTMFSVFNIMIIWHFTRKLIIDFKRQHSHLLFEKYQLPINQRKNWRYDCHYVSDLWDKLISRFLLKISESEACHCKCNSLCNNYHFCKSWPSLFVWCKLTHRFLAA